MSDLLTGLLDNYVTPKVMWVLAALALVVSTGVMADTFAVNWNWLEYGYPAALIFMAVATLSSMITFEFDLFANTAICGLAALVTWNNPAYPGLHDRAAWLIMAGVSLAFWIGFVVNEERLRKFPSLEHRINRAVAATSVAALATWAVVYGFDFGLEAGVVLMMMAALNIWAYRFGVNLDDPYVRHPTLT